MALFEVEKIILDKLTTLSGPSVKLDTITTTCTFITELLFGKTSQPFTLQQFAEIVFEGFCKVQTKIDSINTAIPPYVFNVNCLTGTLETKDDIIQAIINKVCDVNTRLVAIETKYISQVDLCAQVKACIVTVASSFKDRMVPYTYIPYAGPLSNFDNTGKGLLATGFDKIFLANGLNSTQDWRGRSPIGAVLNVPGTTLDSTVSNPSYNYAVGVKYGLPEVVLTVNQNGAHTHAINDPGHNHTIAGYSGQSDNTNDRQVMIPGANTTGSSVTGITLGSSGNGEPHLNIQPSIACTYIVHIP